MKLYKTIITALAGVAAVGFAGCSDDFDRPPVIVPEATYEVNTAISEFKEMFWNVAEANSYATIPVNADGDSIILGGRIISSDEDGNVYQHVYFRDETGAMDMRIYGYDLYQSYPMGQEVRINVTGLLVGGYGKQMQIGTLYNGGVGGMDKSEFLVRAQRNGLPSKADAEPLTVTLGDLASWINDKAQLIKWQCQLVKLENVSFVGGGSLGWCDAPGQTGTTTRQLKDAQGNTIDVRTSNKSTFSSEVLPAGTGTAIAILGYYATSSKASWQLTFMDPQTGCIDGFEFVDTPAVTPSGDAVFSETFKDGIGGFTIENTKLPVDVSYVWNHDASYACMKASAYVGGKSYATDSYLISPVIDLSKAAAPVLTFEHAVNKFASLDAAKEQITVEVREEGTSAWTKLAIPEYGTNSSWTFNGSGNISLAAYAGKKVQVAFHYTSTDASSGTWEVKNVVVR